MHQLKTETLRQTITALIVCSLLTAAVITSTAFSIQRVGAQAAEDVDVAVVSITHVVYYPAVYVYKGQMRVGHGNASPAVLVYLITLHRTDNNNAVPALEVDVMLERVNLTYSPAETFSIVNTTSVVLIPGEVRPITLTWWENGNTSKLAASPIGVTWMIGCLANVTGPSGANDTDLNDNLLWDDNTVAYTGLVGDVNGDGFVDIYDAILLSNAFGTTTGQIRWNADCDLNSSGSIDIFDAIWLAGNFNKHMP